MAARGARAQSPTPPRSSLACRRSARANPTLFISLLYIQTLLAKESTAPLMIDSLKPDPCLDSTPSAAHSTVTLLWSLQLARPPRTNNLLQSPRVRPESLKQNEAGTRRGGTTLGPHNSVRVVALERRAARAAAVGTILRPHPPARVPLSAFKTIQREAARKSPLSARHGVALALRSLLWFRAAPSQTCSFLAHGCSLARVQGRIVRDCCHGSLGRADSATPPRRARRSRLGVVPP